MGDDHTALQGWRLDQERRGLLPRTIYHRCSQLRAWIRWCEDRGGIAAQQAEDVQRFLDARRIGSKTRYGWISTLHCFYTWAVDAGHATTNPTERITRPKLRRNLPRPISDDDLAMALRLATPMMRAWLMLAAYTGCRCAEIGRLRREDLIDDGDLVRLLGKGEKERVVTLHPAVLDALRGHGLPRRGYLFTRPGGGPYPPHLVSRHGNQYLRDIGLDVTMHQLRHWFGTRTYQQCSDIRVVQELMGHASPATTAVYAAFAPGTASQAVRQLPMVDGSDQLALRF